MKVKKKKKEEWKRWPITATRRSMCSFRKISQAFEENFHRGGKRKFRKNDSSRSADRFARIAKREIKRMHA